MAKEKKWFQSKTKIGTLLIAAGPVLITLGGLLTGNIPITNGITALVTQMGAVLAVFGLRDLPFVNKK